MRRGVLPAKTPQHLVSTRLRLMLNMQWTLCGAKDSATLTFPYSFRGTKAQRILQSKRTPKLPREQRLELRRAAPSGGVLGWLAGIGTLAIPGVGPLVAAGLIVAALTGVGVGGAIGGIASALVGMGIPEYEAKRYEGRIKSGGI